MKAQPFDLAKLHPKAQGSFRLMTSRLKEAWAAGLAPAVFLPFEGYRPPERQLTLLAEGTTKARPWQSAHNYGLAVDYVPYQMKGETDRGWRWPDANWEGWRYLQEVANASGLMVPITWDKPHVEHPIWTAVKGHLV